MSLTNKERIGRCVELLRTALEPEVRQGLQQAYGDDWLEHVRLTWKRSDRPAEKCLDDVGVLLGVVLAHWDPLFRQRFDGVDESFVQSAREVRNEWAHRPQEEFTAARASELLERVAAILSALGCNSDASIVRFEIANVTDASVSEPDRRLRAILIDIAAQGQPFAAAVTRSKRLGLSPEEVAMATKALRASHLLAFDDPLTDTSAIRLAG